MRVRFRVDGVLREIMKSNIQMLEPVISRIKIMAELNIAEKRIPQDGRISFKAKQKNIDIRVAIAPTIYGEKVVMRLLDKGNFTLSLEKLGLESKDYNRVKEIISKPYGIILVCGPTGSGKTTSLYSALNEVNNVEKNVITVEDPVEYNIFRSKSDAGK
jgi:type IV pilus assembly protein PilB